ncbi:MAG TPA: FtsX-like permease family protein [Fibrobacteria bacterium]|nr:FtsX-like permease family protein [Fibrobacteria bacterium]
MGLVLTIAWRNLFRHRGQSLVVGVILFLGALLMTVGNGVVSGMDRGLEETVVRGFTGDLILVPDAQASDNVFLEMMGRAVEPLHGFPQVEKALKGHPLVDRVLPVGKNMVMVLNEDGGMPTFLYLLGVDFARYAEMFPGTLNLKEGRMPAPGGPGLLLPTGAREEIHNTTNIWFIPEGASLDTANLDGDAKKHKEDLVLKSSMVMLGFNAENSTTDIRLDVDGVFRYRALNTIFGSFALVDIESYRQCLGYFLASERTQGKVSGEDSALFALEDGGLDALFAGGSLVEDRPAAPPAGSPTAPAAVPSPPAAVVVDTAKTGYTLADSGRPARVPSDLDQGAYNLVLVLLKDGVDPATAITELNALFKKEKLGVRAVTWKSSLGPVGSMASLIKGALFVFTSFLFLVAVIIIINTLTMAALERTPEIGMMRAIGAKKGFISLMFLAETGALSLVFGGLGILAGMAVVEGVSLFHITSDNDMLQLFYGGDTFRPRLHASDLALCLLQLALVSLAAVVYPVRMARRVSPLDAVYKE